MRYTFSCDVCSHNFEIDIPMSEYDNCKYNTLCPVCKKSAHRVFEAYTGSIKLGAGMYGIDNGKGWNS